MPKFTNANPNLPARYHFLGCAGQGAHSLIYRAEDTRTKQLVAVRLPREDIPNEDAARVHRHELAAGKHEGWRSPAVAQLLDDGMTDDNRPFLVTEWIEGKTLSAYLKERGAMSVSSVVLLFGPLANALDKAHRAGLRHGDLKPSNLMIANGDAPRAVLIDFGLAQDSNADLTQTTAVRGTPRYLAPELITGKPSDHRADLYALACILYECLTGQPPFAQADTPALLYAHTHTEPALPSEINPLLSPKLDALLMRALAKDPAQRFASATALLDALFHATAHAPQPRAAPAFRRWVVAVAGLVLLMGVGGWLVLNQQGRLRTAEAVVASPSAPQAATSVVPVAAFATQTPAALNETELTSTVPAPAENTSSPNNAKLLFTPATASGNTPLLHEGAFYISDGQGRINKVDANNGELIWQVQLDAPLLSELHIWRNELVAVNERGQVQAWTLTRGVPSWTRYTNYANQAFVLNDKLVVVRWENLVVLDGDPVRETLVYTRESEAGWNTDFRVNGDFAWASLWNGSVRAYAINDSSMNVVTRLKEIDTGTFTSVPVLGEGLIAASYKRGIVRVWGEDGTEKWVLDLGEQLSAGTAPLIVRVNDAQVWVLVSVEDGTLRAFDVQSKAEVWRSQFGAALRHAPVLWQRGDQQGVVVGASNGEVRWLSLVNGELWQSWQVQGSVRSPVVVDAENNRAFVRANEVWVLAAE